MRKLMIICLCFSFYTIGFCSQQRGYASSGIMLSLQQSGGNNEKEQSEASKSKSFNKKKSVSKASRNGWHNDISKSDCRVLTFSFAGEIIQSENIVLKSREQWEYCKKGKKEDICQALNAGPFYKKSVRIEIHPALKMYPWEYNRFKICLKGANFSIEQIKTAYDYNISKSHIGDITLFIAKPGRKIKMDPDINGLSVKSIERKEDAIIFKLTDKWSAHYSGKTEIKMSLFKKRFFKDKYVGKYSSFDFSNDLYEIILPKELTGALKPGKYYFKWNFRRIGDNVSNPVLIDKGKTPIFKIS